MSKGIQPGHFWKKKTPFAKKAKEIAKVTEDMVYFVDGTRVMLCDLPIYYRRTS